MSATFVFESFASNYKWSSVQFEYTYESASQPQEPIYLLQTNPHNKKQQKKGNKLRRTEAHTLNSDPRMAQLLRYLFVDDRSKSEIFTFMIPSNFILDNETDLKSRDFTSSNQKWSLSFTKVNEQLSVFVTLKSAYEGMVVMADYGNSLFISNRTFFVSQFLQGSTLKLRAFIHPESSLELYSYYSQTSLIRTNLEFQKSCPD